MDVPGECRINRGTHDEFSGGTTSLQGFDQSLHLTDLKVVASRDTD